MLGLLILCGAFIIEAQAFIGGNAVSSISDRPYACSIRDSRSDEYICMCTLIDNKWAVTIADYIIDYPKWNLYVVVGMLNGEDSTMSKHLIKNYIIHDNYNLVEGVASENNIALIELDTPVTFPGFRGASIPENQDKLHNCQMVSYGNINNDCVNLNAACTWYSKGSCSGEYQRINCRAFCQNCSSSSHVESPLQEISLEKMPSPRCEKDFPTDMSLGKQLFCAAASGFKKRAFDNAAPLICKSENKDYVVGLFLLDRVGDFKDNAGYAGIFHSTYLYSKWISEMTGFN